MDPTQESRLVEVPEMPKSVYLETLGVFLLGNFIFHRMVFRIKPNNPQFAAFIVVNAFTSFMLSQGLNNGVTARNAAIVNNVKEHEHQLKMN